MAFIVINIPKAIMPIDRGELFEDPMFDAFEAEGLTGGPCGGGTALGEDENGQKIITSCDIEVEVEDDELDRALAIIRRVLVAGGAPPDSTIRQCEPVEVVYPLHEA